MDCVRRLHLLFENDGELLCPDTVLHHLPSSHTKGQLIPSESVPVKVEAERSSDGMDTLDSLVATMEAVSVKETAEDEIPSSVTPAIQTTESDLSTSFCPIIAVSRYPYKYIKGELSKNIVQKFFDEGKFWNREWTL